MYKKIVSSFRFVLPTLLVVGFLFTSVPQSASAVDDIIAQGSITVTKTTHGGDASFPLTLSGDANASGSVSTTGGTATFTFENLSAGTYSVTEDFADLPLWQEVSNTCDGIVLAQGENATCEIVNKKAAEITIRKVSTGDTGTFHFEGLGIDGGFDITTSIGIVGGWRQDETFNVFVDLDGSDLSVTETVPEGWQLTSIECDNFLGDVESATATFNDVLPGEARKCIFRNSEIAPPQQCEEGEQWAYEVESSDQGTRRDGSGVLASRTNPDSVLGAPDGNGTAGTGFFSLGVDGTITVKFNHFIENVSGDDLYFYEITNGRTTYPEELAKVEVSQDGSTWYDIGIVSSKPTGVDSLDFDSTGLDWIMFVRVTDVTNFGLHSNDADGYDLDAIKASNGLCEEPEEPLSCVPDLNLLTNSGFETPDVTHNAGWNIFASGTLGLDWIVDWADVFDSAPGVANLELHGGVNGWLPNSGLQYAELDTDWGGPDSGQNGEQASVAIYQNVPTILGETYTLSYNFSPRPGADNSQNILEVLIDGILKDTHSALGGSQTSWTPYSLTFAGTGAPTKIEFRDAGTPDSVGTFLDDVSLVCGVDCVQTEGTISSDADTQVINVVFDLSDPDTTVDYPAPLVSVVPAIQALAAGVWGADVSDTDAKWIWSSDPYDPDWQVDKWVTFERTFSVVGTPQTGTLKIASDNSYEVWVNGILVGSDTADNNHSIADTLDVSSFLNAGANTLEIRVKNLALPNSPQANNPGGLLYSLSWVAEDCDDDPPPPPQCEYDEYLNEDNQCVPNEPDPATITIVKNTVDSNGTFNFYGLDGQDGFSLTTEDNTASTFFEVEAGEYTITEDVPENWDLTSVTCEYDNYSYGTDVENGKDVTVDEGDEITCTFTNTFDDDDGEPEDTANTTVVTGNTSLGENQLGWLFNRDSGTQTPFEFNSDFSSIGSGSLFVELITNTINGNNDKFIGELFLLTPMEDIESVSYDFQIGAPDNTVEEHFYMNVYANFGESSPTKFYDCRYNVVPVAGSTGAFTTVTFDPTLTYPVTTRTGGPGVASPHPCPASPADMDTLSPGSTVRVIALNVGDTSGTDTGISGYLDRVITAIATSPTTTHTETYDFEPTVLTPTFIDDPSDDNPGSRSRDFSGGSVAGASIGQVLGQSCGLYMDRFIRFGSNYNDVEQVKLLQTFLNKWMLSTLPVTGIYNSATLEVLKAFQVKYASEILTPWNLNGPTGIVYQTTLRWINMLECPDLALQIPQLVEWSRNPAVPKEPLAVSTPTTSTAPVPPSPDILEAEEGDEEAFVLESLPAAAGEAKEGGRGFWGFIKGLFGN